MTDPNDRLRSTWAPRRAPNDPLRSTLHRISRPFSLFFEGRSGDLLDVQRNVPNLCFCWQVRYFRGLARTATTPKSDTFRRNIAPTMVRERAVRTNSRVCRSSTPLGANCGHLGAPLDAPGRSPRASSTNLGRLDRPRSTHFDRLGRQEEPQATHVARLRRFDRPCALARTTCHGLIDLARSTWLHRSGHVATA